MTLKANELRAGDTYSECIVADLKQTQITMYADASGDYNSTHTDEPLATQVADYPSVSVHKILTMGMTGRMLTNFVGDGRLTEFGVCFTGQVFPGDTLYSTATVVSIERDLVNLNVSTINQKGIEVVKGTAQARIDI